MTPVPFDQISYIQIFPPIGVARLGDSGFNLDTGKPDGDIQWFLPSELPGTDDMPASLNGQFREGEKSKHPYRIKRQAVRFRVYAYAQDGKNLGEITSGRDSPYQLNWTVHVANHKPAYYLFAGEYQVDQKDQTKLSSGEKRELRNPDVQGGTPENPVDPAIRKKLQVDAGAQRIANARGSDQPAQPVTLSGDFYGSQPKATTVYLGQLRTDERGRLIFIGGAGYSRSVGKLDTTPHFQPDITSDFDGIDWVDDVCDGWVTVEVQHPNLRKNLVPVHKSTVVSGPPKFAWGINSPISLYDLFENIYNEHGNWRDHAGSNFYLDIWPVMHSAYALSWVNKDAYEGHGVGGKGNFLPMESQLKSKGDDSRLLREHVFHRLRLPDYEDINQANTMYMPRLSGNNGDSIEPGMNLWPGDTEVPPIKRFASLTKLQYNRFKAWKEGNFVTTPLPWSKFTSFDQVPAQEQPAFLTRAALEHTIGEPFFPGLEMTWISRLPEVYILRSTTPDRDPPFRVNHDKYPPGHLGRGLSLPWQSDYAFCEVHWWPSGRPDDVINTIFLTEQATTNVISEKDFLDNISPKRRKWARGMRVTPHYPVSYLPGCTDMVRHWNNLGFIAKDPRFVIGDARLPVWVENERMRINEDAQLHDCNELVL
ncbi:hypothetical protein V8B97DRAFT_2016672 [Scleroderma yunnanense]